MLLFFNCLQIILLILFITVLNNLLFSVKCVYLCLQKIKQNILSHDSIRI